jgi:hypothetical protein
MLSRNGKKLLVLHIPVVPKDASSSSALSEKQSEGARDRHRRTRRREVERHGIDCDRRCQPREREREREREKGGGRELLAVFVYEDTSTRKRIYKIESIFQPLPSFLLLIKRYRYNRF